MVTYIYLCSRNKYSSYNNKTLNINVVEKNYEACKLFKLYEHKPNPSSIPGSLKISKENNSDQTLTLQETDAYFLNGLSDVDVYFWKHDEKLTNPLLFVMYFTDSRVAKPRYLKYSEYTNFIENNNSTKNIVDLSEYDVENGKNELINSLISEINRLDNLFAYNICQKTTNSYNNDKLKVTQDNSHIKESGFIKYTHSPKLSDSSKKACVIYENDVLYSGYIERHFQSKEITEIQNCVLTIINVYWSPEMDLPLLVECVKKSDIKSEYLLYYQKKYKHNHYWEKLDSRSYKSITNEDIPPGTDITTVLSETNNLIKVLTKVQTSLQDDVIVLIEKHTNNFKLDFKYAIENNDSIILKKLTDAQPNTIEIDELKDCSKLEENGYHCYYHDIIPNNSHEHGKLRLLMPNTNNNKYQEVTLYGVQKIGNESNRDHIRYKKGNNILYVYFYGSDRRPLLVCYNNKVYRATNETDYDEHKWTKTTKTIKCGCETSDSKENLLSELSKVVCFLNKVNLCQNDFNYEVHKFDGKPIQITVSTESLNKSCYTKNTHKPQDGHRLGNVIYNNGSTGKKGSLTYDTKKQLKCVCVYYYNNDTKNQFPLLVELYFKGDQKEYYELSSTKANYEWQSIESQKVSEQVKLLNELNRLNKKFNNDYKVSDEGTMCVKTEQENSGISLAQTSKMNWGAFVGTTFILGLFGGLGYLLYKYNFEIMYYLRT